MDEEFEGPKIDKLIYENDSSWVHMCAWWAEQFHTMPDPGGLKAQSESLMEDLKLYFRAREQVKIEYREWKALHGGEGYVTGNPERGDGS